MTQSEQDIEHTEGEEDSSSTEVIRIPPNTPKISRFGGDISSKFSKGATTFSPPNKQRPGRAAGRGR